MYSSTAWIWAVEESLSQTLPPSSVALTAPPTKGGPEAQFCSHSPHPLASAEPQSTFDLH